MESAPGRVEVLSACRRAAWRFDSGAPAPEPRSPRPLLRSRTQEVFWGDACLADHELGRVGRLRQPGAVRVRCARCGESRRMRHGPAHADLRERTHHGPQATGKNLASPCGHRLRDRATEPHRVRVSGLTHNKPWASRGAVKTAVRMNPQGHGNAARDEAASASENIDRARGPTDS